MSVAGDMPDFNFAGAQVEDRNDRRWSTSWWTRRARRSRLLTSPTPYGYGAISPTKLDRRRPRPANTDDEELSHPYIPGLNTSCAFVSAVVCCAIVLAIVFYFAGIGERHTVFPPPMDPEELERYRNSGIKWDTPRSLECLGEYYYRRYAAHLQNVSHARGFDTLKACKALPITIKEHLFETPEECRGVGAYMYGYWTLYDPSDCTIDDEIQRYRGAGMFWNTTVQADHCYSYDKRGEYEARLLNIPTGYDPMKACRYIPIRIQDQVMERPDSCELRDSEVLGKWVASNQMDCRPYWGPLHDAGCQPSGKKRYEAPLWNLNEKEVKYRSPMCYSTPATWHGIYYAHPTVCDDRKRGGMTGIWETESC